MSGMTPAECTVWLVEHAPDDVALHVAQLHLDKGDLSEEIDHLKNQLVRVGQGLVDDIVASCADKERIRLVEQLERLKHELTKRKAWDKRVCVWLSCQHPEMIPHDACPLHGQKEENDPQPSD